MKTNKKWFGYMLGVLLLFGITTIASSEAQAQWGDRNRQDRRDDRNRRNGDWNDRNRRDDRDGRYGYEGLQVARQQGYSYGMNVGAADAQRGQSYSPQRSRYWKNGDADYRSSYGNKGQYKQVFRDAFAQGYREGYQRYGNNRRGNNGRWGNGRSPW
jgi:hypothetical protein